MPLALRYLYRRSVSSPSSSLSSMAVPRIWSEIFATESFATRFVIPALAPTSLNFTGTGRPILKMELPSGRMGLRKKVPSDGASYWTQTVRAVALVLPLASDAVQLTVVRPGTNFEPDAGVQATFGLLSAASVAAGGE